MSQTSENAGGDEIWEFAATATGNASLRLEYVPPDSEEETDDEFQVEVTVEAVE